MPNQATPILSSQINKARDNLLDCFFLQIVDRLVTFSQLLQRGRVSRLPVALSFTIDTTTVITGIASHAKQVQTSHSHPRQHAKANISQKNYLTLTP